MGRERLDSWKAIAAYLKRDKSTVRRWEKEGLPIRRHRHAKKAAVYAYPSEIDLWWNADRTQPERAAPREITSIAVLPLANLSGDPGQNYFADGMTEALITELGGIGSLRVVSRTSAIAYKDSKKALDQIARELNVDAVVEGAVVRESGRARITVQLIGTQPERQLWAERYERDVSSILALQRDVAGAVAEGIHAKLTPKERILLAQPRSVDPDAYEAYLKGRYYSNKVVEIPENLLKARESFEAAIRKDPGFAPAHAGLARSYAWSYDLPAESLRPPREVFPKAKAAALKALELDETLADAHLALAYIKEAYDWDWDRAEHAYQRAIELNPSSVDARFEYARFLAIPRRFDEAFAQIKRNEQLDPVARADRFRNGKGWLYYWAFKFDRALHEAQSLLELEPCFARAHYLSGLVYTQKALYEEAIASHRKAIAQSGEDSRSLALLASAHGRAGQTSEALGIVARLNERAKREYISGLWMAQAHLGLGNNEEALQWLERGFQERDELGMLARSPFWYGPLRSEPRFRELLRRLRLPD
jgi:TolB-like protein/Tfp pilus assembly protein PilF